MDPVCKVEFLSHSPANFSSPAGIVRDECQIRVKRVVSARHRAKEREGEAAEPLKKRSFVHAKK